VDAVRHAVERQTFGYPLTEEFTRFQAVTATWLHGSGLEVLPEHIFMLPDVMKGIENALAHFTPADRPIAVLTPTYSAFFDTLWIARRSSLEVALAKSEHGYHLDLDAVEAAFKAGASTLLLCNPSNPTGIVFSADELRRLATLAAAYGARVFSDEVHAPLSYPGVTPVSYASVSPEAAATAITFTSASKTWNIPGLCCAVLAFTNPDDVTRWHELPFGAKVGISPLGIHATIAAFEAGKEWLDAVVPLLEAKRDLVVQGLNSFGHGSLLWAPQATYLGWVDLTGFDIEAPHTYLLQEAAIAVTPGIDHGAAGAGHIRINLATPDPQLHEFLDRMQRALDKLPRHEFTSGQPQ
jgi:cystathionine beta-lyase